MKIPNQVKVGGMKYKVLKKYKFIETELAGQTIHTQNEIKLNYFNMNNQRFNQQKIDECFIHEIIHAIDCVYNGDKLQEEVVDRLSQGIYQVFTDNKIF